MPKMLTVDAQFEALVAGMARDVRADKMVPFEEPQPEEKPSQGRPEEGKPSEEKPSEGK